MSRDKQQYDYFELTPDLDWGLRLAMREDLGSDKRRERMVK